MLNPAILDTILLMAIALIAAVLIQLGWPVPMLQPPLHV